jgi:ATP-dependent Lhr-like helicase
LKNPRKRGYGRSSAMDTLPEPFAGWFAARGWQPHRHQFELMASQAAAQLLIAPTGAGKTLAGFLPSLIELSQSGQPGLHTLYISPLKALAADIGRNLRAPVAEVGLTIRIEDRTGDTPQSQRRRQRADPPHILLTTPESLALMLSWDDAPRIFAGSGASSLTRSTPWRDQSAATSWHCASPASAPRRQTTG